MPLPPRYWEFQSCSQLPLLTQLWRNLCAILSLHGMQLSPGWVRDRIEVEVENRLRVARLARCRRVRMEGYPLRRYTTAYRRTRRAVPPSPRFKPPTVYARWILDRKTGNFVEAPPRVN